MEYPLEATGTHASGRPLLIMQDQDHPDRMNQIVWSLMAILDWAEIEGISFDADNPASFHAVRDAIAAKINAAKISVAGAAEVRKATDNVKYLSPLSSLAARGQFAGCVNVAANTVLNAQHSGNLIVASGSTIASITLPPLADLGTGSAVTIVNQSTKIVSVVAPSLHELMLNGELSASVNLLVGQSLTAVKLAASQWQIVLDGAHVPLSREWTSVWHNYNSRPGTAGFQTSFYYVTHNLAAVPKLLSLELECLIAEGNFKVGDILEVGAHQIATQGGTSSFHAGFCTIKSATQISIAFDANHGMMLHEFLSNSHIRLTNNRWRWRLRGWV